MTCPKRFVFLVKQIKIGFERVKCYEDVFKSLEELNNVPATKLVFRFDPTSKVQHRNWSP